MKTPWHQNRLFYHSLKILVIKQYDCAAIIIMYFSNDKSILKMLDFSML